MVLELSAIKTARKVNEALPILDLVVRQQEEAVKKRVFVALQAGKLTPEEALSSWYELFALSKVAKRFENKLQEGIEVAGRNEAVLRLE